MTDLFEVKDPPEDLQDTLEELKYEAATQPGEGPEVEALFLSSSQKIQEAIEVLEEAIEIMKVNRE